MTENSFEINTYLKWFVETQPSYTLVSQIFSKFGKLLIDADTLVDILIKQYDTGINDKNNLSNYADKIQLYAEKLYQKFIKCGFHHINIVLNKEYSQINQQNIDLTLLFRTNNFLIFDNCRDDAKWCQYLNETNIGLFIINESDIFRSPSDQYKYMFELHQKEVTIMLASTVQFQDISLFGFLITQKNANKFENIIKMVPDKNKTIEDRVNEILKKFRVHDNFILDKLDQINHFDISDEKLDRLLSNNKKMPNSEDCTDSNGNGASMNVFDKENGHEEIRLSDSESDSEDESRKKKNRIIRKNEKSARYEAFALKSKQKYYRHLEKYSNSLESSKSLHHTIRLVINEEQNDNTAKHEKSKKENCKDEKVKKLSAKEEKIIKENEERKLKQLLGNQMSTFKHIEASIENVDCELALKRINGVNLNSYLPEIKKKFLLLKLNAFLFNFTDKKILKNEKKTELIEIFLLVKEIILNNYEHLNQDEVKKLLKVLVDYNLKASAYELQNYLKEKKIIKQDIFKLKFDIHDFNQDILFEMKFCGDRLKRTLNSVKDPRVLFEPDEWQVKLLNAVDNRESALLCCPTSSGKTFISYYAMESILRRSNEDVLVFVAPNYVLANQVTAEIYARFGSKPYPKNCPKDVFAISIQKFTINKQMDCQILITEPSRLEVMLTTQAYADWFKKIKYIVIDEVQTINYPLVGSSIEKLIHFADCPILALSATIGNYEDFFKWMQRIDRLKGRKSNLIIHKERYCDLKKFVFAPDKDAIDLSKVKTAKSPPDQSALVHISDMIGYTPEYLKQHDFAPDFNLLPGELVDLYDALEVVLDAEQKRLIDSLKPNSYFKSINISKNDVKNYEKELISVLIKWIRDDTLSKDQVSRIFQLLNGKCHQLFDSIRTKYGSKFFSEEWGVSHIYQLITLLNQERMLPAIVFSDSYSYCDKLAERLIQTILDAETFNKIVDEELLKKQERQAREKKRKRDEPEKRNTVENLQKEAEELDEKIDLNVLDEDFSLLDSKYRCTETEINEEIEQIKHKSQNKVAVSKLLQEGLRRGIGIHHENYHNKWRQAVEYLFRKRHLQVVFATETLSLGINMPCKTVVLTNNAMSIDSNLYRQMSGRAGRRGFDNIGHVVFYGVAETKIRSLIASELLEVKGPYTFEPNNLLQFSYMHSHNKNTYKYLNSIIEHPIVELRYNYNKKLQKDVLKLQFDYLASNGYFDKCFNKTDKSNFALNLRNYRVDTFHIQKLISSGLIELVCNNTNLTIDQRCELLVLIFSHFIEPEMLPKSLAEIYKNSNLSQLVLPNIPFIDSFVNACTKEIDDSIRELLESKLKINNKDEINELTEMYRQAFPYKSCTFKNSYIYDFYVNGSIKRIEEMNGIEQTKLWHAYEHFLRVLVNIIIYFEKKDNKNVLKVLNECEKNVDERFSLIKN